MNRLHSDAESRARTDEEVIADIRAGDAEAWAVLVQRYESLVMSVPRRMGLSHEDAEEVFQATWRTLCEHLRSIREPGRIAYWIRTTAQREAWRLARELSSQNLPESEIEALISASKPSVDPSNQLDRREASAEVVAALDQLGPRCQLLLTRLFLDPSTPAYADLGAELGIPTGSVGPTRVRCLEKLAQILGAENSDP